MTKIEARSYLTRTVPPARIRCTFLPCVDPVVASNACCCHQVNCKERYTARSALQLCSCSSAAPSSTKYTNRCAEKLAALVQHAPVTHTRRFPSIIVQRDSLPLLGKRGLGVRHNHHVPPVLEISKDPLWGDHFFDLARECRGVDRRSVQAKRRVSRRLVRPAKEPQSRNATLSRAGLGRRALRGGR